MSKVHPLLLKESSIKYDVDSHRSKIYEWESKLSIREMIGAMKRDVMKFNDVNYAMQDDLAAKKIHTTGLYLAMLEEMVHEYSMDDSMSCRHAIDIVHPDMSYTLSEHPSIPGLR